MSQIISCSSIQQAANSRLLSVGSTWYLKWIMFFYSPYHNPLIFTPAKIHPSSLFAWCCRPHLALYKIFLYYGVLYSWNTPRFSNCCVFPYNLATSFPQNSPSTPRFNAIRKYMNCIPTSRMGHVVRMGEGRGVHRVLVGKPEGKRPLGRPRCRWEDNIKMDLKELGGTCGDWMELAQDRDSWWALVGTVRNLWVPKCGEFLD